MKKFKKILFVIILIAIFSTATFFIGRKIGLNTDVSSTSTTIEEKTVEKRTITKTLSATGEISSASTESLSLDTSKYFETMCVEENDSVGAGENILKYTDGSFLTAPYNLVVSSYSVPTTEEICEDENYIKVQNLDSLTTTLSINESEISNISLNQEVEVVLSADTSKVYTGTVSKIDAIGTYSSSGTTYSVTVSFTNDGSAKLGMSVSCTINISELTDVLTVPIDAVQISNNKKYVLVVENGETTQTEIETGLSDDEYVEVKSGLTEGQVVQVITTTTQSTTRSDSSSNGDFMNVGGGSMPDMQDFDSSSIPDMPSMPSGGGSFDKN